MRIECKCGAQIHCNTDYLSNHAHFVADQDLFDLYKDIERLTDSVGGSAGAGLAPPPQHLHQEVVRSISRASRVMYQCPNCARLWVDDVSGGLRSFAPDDPAPAAAILGSKKGPKWKSFLWGEWASPPADPGAGILHWGAGTATRSETFDTFEALATRYHEIFAELRADDVLRQAWLRNRGETVHYWHDERSG